MVLITTPNDVVLSILIGVGVYSWPMSINMFRIDTVVVAFRKRPPSSTSAVDDITVFISVGKQCIGPFSFEGLWEDT